MIDGQDYDFVANHSAADDFAKTFAVTIINPASVPYARRIWMESFIYFIGSESTMIEILPAGGSVRKTLLIVTIALLRAIRNRLHPKRRPGCACHQRMQAALLARHHPG
jgi:hypothetical protein